MKRYILMLALCVTMLANAVCANAAVTFDLAGQIGSEVSSFKINNLKPFVEKAKSTEPQFYLDDEPVEPVVRIRFDEGEGSTVTGEVSGEKIPLTITGSDYEWIDNADIRYGGTAYNKYKQHSALKLNSSYIDLGDLSNLSDSMNDGFTLIYWTNYEIFNKADNGYEEPAHLQYSGSITRGNYDAAYKYDKERYNVIMQSDNIKIGAKKRALAVNDTSLDPGAIMYNDFYNMYTIVVDQNDSGEWTMTFYGNDGKPEGARTATFAEWNPETVFSGNLYIGTPDADSTYGSPQLGIADLMIFDKPLTYQERLEIFYGYKQTGYYLDGVPTN